MREKFFSIICAFSLLINSLFPIFSVGAVYAEDSTGSATVASPSPSASEAPSPSPSIEPTDAPTPLPSPDPTPTPIISPSPEISPQPIVSTIPSTEPENTPTPAPDENIGQANAPPGESPSPSETPEPSPSADVEQAPTGHIFATILENTDAETLELDLSTQNDVSSATLTTDKADYAPTDTVVISGSDFLPDTTYTLVIFSSDPPAVNFQEDITTNDQGSFIYSYQLDGTYRPNYLVELKDEAGDLAASTVFTDAPVSGCANDSAGANDQPNQKDLSKMCVNYSGLPTSIDVSWNWDDTGFNGENTGDACSLYDTDGDGLANYSLCVGVTGNPAVWSYTKLYSCGDGRVDRCDQPTLLINNPTSSCSASVQGTDPFPGPPNNEQGDDYPNDTEANCNVNMSDIGGSTAVLLDVCSYPSGQPNSDPSDCIIIQNRTGKLEVVKDLIPDSDSGLFNLQINGVTEAANVGDGGTTGEKVLDEGAHTVGETAGTSTNLGNYTTAIVCKDLNGTGSIVAQSSNAGPLSVNLSDQQDIVCTITNSLQDGTIIVHKDVQGPNGEDVLDNTSFTVNLDGTNAESITESTTVTYNNVAAGTHTITEDTPPAGYTLFSLTPDNDAGTSGAQITVNPGLTTDVYVVNRQQHTRLTVTKIVTNDNGGTKVVSDFPLFIDQTQVTSGQANNVNPGTYTVSETGDSGYTETISGDCNADGTITLALGDNKTCTITNDDTPAHLIVIKHVIKDNGGNAVASDFTMTINDVIASGGNSFPGQAAPGTNKTLTTVGSYSVTESGPTGYNASFSSDCNGSIALGQTKTCTITNDDVSPTITLIKVVENDNGGNAGPNDFGISVGGQVVNSGTTLDVNSHTPIVIDEAGLSGYGFVSITGDNKCPTTLGGTVALNEGEDITCTITNDDQPAHLKVIKHVVKDNGGAAEASDFTMTINGVVVQSGGSSFNGEETPGTVRVVEPGTYSVTESGPDGYQSNFSTDCSGTISLGQTKTCTVTNDDIAPSLTLIKYLPNDNGGTATESDFKVYINGQLTSWGQRNLNAGQYTISEDTLIGYTPSAWGGDCDVDGTIILNPGDNKICTITNDDEEPSLTLIKVVENGNGGTAQESDWTLTADGPTGFSGNGPVVNNDLGFVAGTYTLSEDGPEGYSASEWVCEGGSQEGNQITLGLGHSATCTITNDDQPGTLTVIKVVSNDNGGEKGFADFSFSVNSGNAVSFEADGQNDLAVDAGTYTVTEPAVAGYSTTYNNCSNISIPNGGSATCTITNDDQASLLLVIKQVINNDGGNLDAINFTLNVTGNQPDPASFPGSESGTIVILGAGSYSVDEDSVPGYLKTLGADCSGTIGNGESKTCTITNDDIPGQINGMKFEDENGDGDKDAGEGGLANWTINISGPVNTSTSTDSNGNYSFTNLPAGTYTVTETDQPGWKQTTPNPAPIVLANDQTVSGVDFGNFELGSVSGKKFEDLDGDGLAQEAGEPSLSGWTIRLYDITTTPWTLVATDVTDDSGEYSFTNLEPGSYRACEVLQSGWTQLFPNIANNNNSPSSSEEGQRCQTVNIDDSGESNTRNFGNFERGLITIVKNTVGGDDTFTYDFMPDEEVFEIQTVDNTGNRIFGDLSAGEYVVTERELGGWDLTDLTCSTGGTANINNKQARIAITSGADITCIFTNTKQGEIIIEKQTDPDGSEQTFEFESDYDDNFFLSDGESNPSGLLEPGIYSVSELTSDADGWDLTDTSCTDGSDPGSIDLSPGETVTCTFTNAREEGEILVKKIIDVDGNLETIDDQIPGVEWSFDVDGTSEDTSDPDSDLTDENGLVEFDSLKTGEYEVIETVQDGYHIISASCLDEEKESETGQFNGEDRIEGVEVNSNEEVRCTFINTRDTGTITILKNIDNNEDGDTDDEEDVRGAEDWTWDILDGDQDIATGQTKTLPTGNYTITEDQQDSYELLGWSCSNEQTGTENSIAIEVTKDSETTCTFTNQLLPPVLSLTKANNRTGIDVSAGADVLYTLTVTLTGSPLSNVSLIDLPPAGFKYRSGSWTAVSSERGDLKPGITTEPTYASPGTWSLGGMQAGETVTLTYIADIDNSTDPGLYKDLAWSSGEGQTLSTVLANENSGFFVGTEVNVVAGSGDSAGVNVVREERGEVLGVSTELPQTGINTLWSILAVLLLTSGAGLIFAGISLRRKYE